MNRAAMRKIGVALVVACIAAGCSTKVEGTAASQLPSTSASSAPGNSTAAEPNSAGRPSTAQQVLADWTGAVIAGDYKRACTDMADTSVSPAKPYTAAMCDPADTKVKTMERVLKGLREAFTPANSTGKPDVKVTGPAPTGDSATIAADKITVDGKPLDQVVLANSTGVKPGETNFTFGVGKIEGGWYVTDFNLDF
jgi:hypothetical protein